MAAILHKVVITNFRNKDVALGGQGAPVCPGGERFLFQEYDYCLNLGGIANISVPGGKGFDICACNQVLNYLVNFDNPNLEYDDDGVVARQGSVIEELLKKLNELDFYNVQPPKSLGREWVQEVVLPMLDVEVSCLFYYYTLQGSSISPTFSYH